MSKNRITKGGKIYLHDHYVGDLHGDYIALDKDMEFTVKNLQLIIGLVLLKEK